MIRFILILFIILNLSCTDQGNPIMYSIFNSSEFDLRVITYERFGEIDTSVLKRFEFKVLDIDGAPYDSGPFSGIDSMNIIFSDKKKLSYVALQSKDDCLIAPKNPYCEFSHYSCLKDTCTFEIDKIEYLKAK